MFTIAPSKMEERWNRSAFYCLIAFVVLPLIFGSGWSVLDAIAFAALTAVLINRATGITGTDLWKMGAIEH